MQILPFNLQHAVKAAEFARILLAERETSAELLKPRAIIINDTKLFAQADSEQGINYFVTSDAQAGKRLHLINAVTSVKFSIIDIAKPYGEVFGVLEL